MVQQLVGRVAFVLLSWRVQERMWKRRAAYQLAQEAAAEGRRRLQKEADAALAAKDGAAKATVRGSKAKKDEQLEQQPALEECIAGGVPTMVNGHCVGQFLSHRNHPIGLLLWALQVGRWTNNVLNCSWWSGGCFGGVQCTRGSSLVLMLLLDQWHRCASGDR